MRIFVVFFSLFLFTNLQANEIVFEHISSNQGLSNNLVRDIIQDEKGYLWMATSGGLNRFDGHSFQTYKTIFGDQQSLSDSRLSVIFEDRNGFIWARSILGNLHRVDPVYGTVINFKEEGLMPQSARAVKNLVASNGDVWLIHSEGIQRMYYVDNDNPKIELQTFELTNWLQNNKVNDIFEDSNRNIWLATNNSIIRLVIPTNEPYKAEPDVFCKGNVSYSVIYEFEQKIYFGGTKGNLCVYDIIKQKMNTDVEITDKLTGNISSISSNDFGTVLIGTENCEMALVDTYNNEVEFFIGLPTYLPQSEIIGQILSDSYGTFWIVTERRGVYHFNPKSNRFAYYGLNYSNREFLGEPDKQIIREDTNRNIWVGINGGGLFLFDRSNDRFQHYRHEPDNTGSLSSDVVLSLYEDRSKNLWIGTSYGGVNKVSLKKDRMSRISPVENPLTGFDNYVRSVTTDVLGNVWIGSKAGKIYVYKNREKIGVIPDDLHNSDAFPPTNVYCLFFDNDHNLWIGTKGYGIYVIKSMLSFVNRLQHNDIEVVHLTHDANNPNSLSSDNVYCIEQDVHGQYWIGTFLGGLDLLVDPFGKPEVKRFAVNQENDPGIVSTEVRDLFFDNQQNLWIATSEGVSILESKYLKTVQKSFINLKPSLINPESMSGNVVYQIKQSKNNDIFLAMLDGGINQLKADDFQNRRFKWIHHESPILSPNVYSIEEDHVGNIWVGTDNGLCRLNPNDGEIEKYNIRNSYLPLTFSETCSHKTTKQELVFGTNDGFLIFHPDSIKKDSANFPILFSKLEVNGEQITLQNSTILKASIETQNEIVLAHNQNNVSLYFSVLDFEQPEAIQYSYILEGYDTFWSNPSTSNSATYRKIEPGEYLMKVKATNSSGSWMSSIANMKIVVTPPFWKSTTGFILIILIVSILITSATIFVYWLIMNKYNTKVEKSLNEKRIEYYTNISHEFKTPLSLILSPVEEIIMSPKSNDFARKKGLQIKKNATYLKRLIDQILDFRKIREGKMQLKVSEINVIEFFREIYLVFLPMSQRLGVNLEYNYNVEKYYGYCDMHQLEKVFYNLLSNAFRYTPQGKDVQMNLTVDTQNGWLKAEVVDNGTGIDEQELPRIFDRFYNSRTGTGIGLFFSKEIVMLHKGQIAVRNNSKGGATFVVEIPINKSLYSADEIDITSPKRDAFDLNSIDDIEVIVSPQQSNYKINHRSADYFETILIVENNDEMRTYLAAELSVKYKVIEAENGLQGIEYARKFMPQLIISDVVMPKADGYELTRTLKNGFDTSHIPIVLLTAEDSEEKKLLGAECGADDYVVKPFNISYLFTKIENIIVQRKKLKKRIEHDIEEKVNDGPDKQLNTDHKFLKKVIDIIIAHLSDVNLNVDFLVDKTGMSRTLFFKKMKSASGYSPNEYLRIIRMKEAARLLSNSDKTISEISNAVGFNDSNYFSKTFKSHFGETPSEYKNKNQKQSLI